VLILGALCALVFFAGLGSAPLWDEDETRFASVAREMLRSGDWVVPHFNGELADKPPLLFWSMAGTFALLGETPGAARVPSAIFAALAVWATWHLTRRLYDRTVAWWSALALATSLLFVAEARLATTDAALLALVTLGLMVLVRAWWANGVWRAPGREPARLRAGSAFLVGALSGLGILTKGPVALVLPALTLWLFVWWSFPRVPGRRGWLVGFLTEAWRAAALLRPGIVLAGVLVVAAPWHAFVWRETGGEWLRLVYLQHYLGRLPWLQPLTGTAMEPPHGHGGFPLFQVVSLLGGLFPWSVLLPLAVWRGFRRAAVLHEPAARLLVLWLSVWLVAVSFSSTQLPHYAFPAYPAACVLVAALLVRGLREPAGMADAWWYAAAGGLAFGGIVLGAVAWTLAVQLAVPGLGGLVWLGAIPLLTAVVFAAAVKRRQRPMAAAALAVGAVALSLAVFVWAAPVVGALNPLAAMIAKADDSASGSARLATYRFGLPGVVWNAVRPVQFCRSAGELAAFLRSGPEARAFVSEAAYAEVGAKLGFAPEVIQRERPLLRPNDVLLISVAADLDPRL
jgi:4-amino-4-deoxy-L-arabinose transferase-like glycosyltransferase